MQCATKLTSKKMLMHPDSLHFTNQKRCQNNYPFLRSYYEISHPTGKLVTSWTIIYFLPGYYCRKNNFPLVQEIFNSTIEKNILLCLILWVSEIVLLKTFASKKNLYHRNALMTKHIFEHVTHISNVILFLYLYLEDFFMY